VGAPFCRGVGGLLWSAPLSPPPYRLPLCLLSILVFVFGLWLPILVFFSDFLDGGSLFCSLAVDCVPFEVEFYEVVVEWS
jgi:hypothetical protein